jgi:hypothetical protein
MYYRSSLSLKPKKIGSRGRSFVPIF